MTVQGLRFVAEKGADPPPKGAGGFPCREYGEWLKRRSLASVGVTRDGIVYDYEKERARLTKAQADRTELEANELRGMMVRADWISEEWARTLGAMRMRLLSMPTKAAPRVRGAMTDESAAKMIEAEVLEALGELSDDGLDARTRARQERSKEHLAPASGADGKPVGGRLPEVVPRKRGRARTVED